MAFFENRFVKWVLAPIAVLWAVGWVYFRNEYPTCTFRYKLTAEVMTPGGVKTGSSVVEVSYHTGPRILPDPTPRFDTLRGEATYVDLGNGKNLVITLGTLDSGREDQRLRYLINGHSLDEKSDYSALTGALNPIWLPIKIFRLDRKSGHEREMCLRVSELNGAAPQPVDLNNLPTLVAFSDVRQPLTAKAVNPNDLSATFGFGYSLSAKVQITSENVSLGLGRQLPWAIAEDRNGLYDVNGKEINRLTRWNFYNFERPTTESYFAN